MTSPLQLPPNAWRNSKNYAADDFPVSTVPGDRIYHNVIGGWWTWLESSPGVGWWTPGPGALMAKIYQQTTATSVPAVTWTKVLNMNGVIKNVNGWWDTANSWFKPDVPGWYEFGGSICWAAMGTPGAYRAVSWGSNGGAVPASSAGNTVDPVDHGTVPTVQLLPNQQVYMNGTTDYVYPLIFSISATSTFSPPPADWRSTNIWVKYMQFEA